MSFCSWVQNQTRGSMPGPWGIEGTRLFGEAQGDSLAAVLHIQELSTDLQENEALMICRMVGLLLLLEVLDGLLDLHEQRNSD